MLDFRVRLERNKRPRPGSERVYLIVPGWAAVHLYWR